MASSVQIPVTQTGLEASIQAALKNAGKNVQINLGANARQINALSQPLGRITGQADEFTKSMEAANARVFAFGASVGIINNVSKAFGALVKNTIAVEKSLVEINSVLGKSSSDLDKFGSKLFEVAKNTGQSFEAVSKGALELARQGLGTEETLKRINDALILTRLSGLDAGKSVEGLTAAVNSFKSTGITTSEVLNKLVNVSQKYSVSEKDLIEGLKRSSSVAKQAGVSFDELVGIITAVQEKSSVGGAVIGNSFKTIFTRLQRRDTLDALQQLGVEVTDVQGKILPATKLLENLAGSIKGLNQIQLAEITEKVGGGFQIDKLISTLEDLGSKGSIAFKATKLSAESANEAYAKNAALNKTLANLINETTLSAQELGATLGKLGITDSAKNLLGFFNNLLESIQKILGEESALGDVFRGLAKGIGNLVTGPGLALFGAIILKLSKDLAQFGFASLKSFFGIGKAAKEIEAVEKSVASALASNINLQRQLFALEGNRAAQIKVMTDAIIQQEAAMRRMTSTSSSLAGPLYQAGVRGTSTGLRVPKAAGGYMPAVAQETSDINRGVGGAKSGDRPVVIPNFNFGGGRKGSMVAHTGEYAVPNFAGSGGTAIFNRDMVRSMGLPSGAKKIGAADGLIPNFAKTALKEQKFGIGGLQGKNLRYDFEKYVIESELEKNDDKTTAPYILAGRIFESRLQGLKYIDLQENRREPDVQIGDFRISEAKLSGKAAYLDSNFGINARKGNKLVLPSSSTKDYDEKLKKDKGAIINRNTGITHASLFAQARSVIEKYKNKPREEIGNRIEIASSGFIPNFAARPNASADTIRAAIEEGIEGYRRPGLNEYGQPFKTYWFPDGSQASQGQVEKALKHSPSVASAKKKEDATKRQKKMDEKGVMDFTIDANTLGGIALVTPARGGSSGTLSAQSLMQNLPKKPEGFLMDDKLIIKNIQSTGVPTQKDFEQISSEINKRFAGPIVDLAQSLYGKLYSGASGSEFASQLGQLRSTSKGGILPPGAEGQIFEAAGKAALTSMNQIASAFDPSKENRPFDFTNAASMKEMLGVKAVRGDAKRAGGSNRQFQETVNGLIKKSINDESLRPKIFSQIKQQTSRRKLAENAASGFVPNFADPLKEAVNREMAAGVPASQIYIDKNESLKSAANPMGLMVANRRDEPAGGHQGISRAIREGRDPKTYGAAGGFMPNYVLPAGGWTPNRASAASPSSNTPASADPATTKASKDMLGTLFALQGAFSVLTGYTDNLSGGIGSVIKELSNLGSGLSTAAFAFSGAKDIATGAKGALGKFVGNLGMVGAVAMGAFEVFKFGKELYNEFSGANERAAKSSIMLADAATNAAFSLDQYSAQSKEDLKKTAEAIYKELNISGVSGPETEKIKEAISQTLGTGASREAVKKSVRESLITEKVSSAGFAGPSGVGYVAPVTSSINKVQNGDTESLVRNLIKLQQGEDVMGISKLQDLILGGVKTEDIKAMGTFGTGFKAADIASLLEGEGAIEASIAEVSKAAKGQDLGGPQSALTEMLGGEDLNWPRVLEFLNAVKKKKEEDAEASKRAAAESAKQFTIDTSRFRAEQEFEKKMQAFKNTAFSSELFYKQQIAGVEQDQTINDEERQKKINEINSAYEKTNLVLKNQEEQQRNLYSAISEGLTGAIADPSKVSEIQKNLYNAMQSNKIRLTDLIDSGDIDKFQEELQKIINDAGGEGVQGISKELINSLSKVLVNNRELTKEREKQIILSDSELKNLQNAINLAADRARTEAKITNEYEARQSSQLYAQELASLNNASEMLSINQEIEKIKNDYSLTEYERAKKTVELEKQKKELSLEAVGLDTAKQRYDLEKKTSDEIRSQISASESLDPIRKQELLRMVASPEALLSAVRGVPDIYPENISAEYKRQQDLINKTEANKLKEVTGGTIPDLTYIQKVEGGVQAGMKSALLGMTNEMDLFAYNIGEKIPQLFADNMSQAISQMIEEGKSFGEVLQSAAYNFVKEINNAMLKNIAQKTTTALGKEGSSIFSNFFASGGRVNGGSGTKDDVPAMLMGGEYVINKKSVQKYGPQFLEALNNGTIGGYAKGGRVQSGKGGFFTPGTYGLGGIEGTGNLLKFASQAYTSGNRDAIMNAGNYASIALEPESVRLTNFGRMNSPQAAATRAAKEQAFGLYSQEMQAQAEARKQAEAEKDAFKKQLIMAAALAAGSYAGGIAKTGFQQGISGAGKDASIWQKFTSGMSGIGEKFGNVGSGITSLFSGDGKAASEYFSMANTNLADVKKGSEVQEFVKQVSGSGYNGTVLKPSAYYTPDSNNLIGSEYKSSTVDDLIMNGPIWGQRNKNAYLSQALEDQFLSGLGIFDYGVLPPPPRATGGTIPSMAGIDTVPAMLSGGEFIMNRSAAQNIGAGNLQALNAGAGSIVTEEKTEELNDKLIAKLDELIEASGGSGAITINVEGSTGTASEEKSGNPSDQKQQLARQIRDAVLKVIQEEKRLGGSLRR